MITPFGQWQDKRLVISCYLLGLLHWVLFLNYGNPTYTYADWIAFKQIFGAYELAFSAGEIPFHVQTLYSVEESYRFFGLPWITAPPQILLLRFIDFQSYIAVQALIFYTLGFAGMCRWGEELKLRNVAWVFLFVLFNFNGSIISRMGIGHMNMAFGLMLIPWLFWILYNLVQADVQNKRRLVVVSLQLVLFLAWILMNSDLHIYYQMVIVSFVIVLFYPRKIIWWFMGTLGSLILSVWYVVPVMMFSDYPSERNDYLGWAGGYGVANYGDLYKVDFDSPILELLIFAPLNTIYHLGYSLVLSIDSSLDTVWEYNIYLGIPGTLILFFIIFSVLRCVKWNWEILFNKRYVAGLLIVFGLSLSVVYYQLIGAVQMLVPSFPVIDGIPSRFIIYPMFGIFLFASFHFESATKFLPAAIKKYMDWLLVLLLAIPLVEHSYIWSVAQTEIRFGSPPRDYPVLVFSGVQDEIYKNVVIGSYLTSWILTGFTLLLYLKLSRRSKNIQSNNSKPASM